MAIERRIELLGVPLPFTKQQVNLDTSETLEIKDVVVPRLSVFLWPVVLPMRQLIVLDQDRVSYIDLRGKNEAQILSLGDINQAKIRSSGTIFKRSYRWKPTL